MRNGGPYLPPSPAVDTREIGNVGDEISQIYGQPVNETDYPGYRKAIAPSDPMDLATILTKINNHEYNTDADFCADVRQIFENGRKFSKLNQHYFDLATDALARFDAYAADHQLPRAPPQQPPPPPPEPPPNEDFAGAPWMANAEICFSTSVALHEGQVTTWSSLRTSSSKWSSHSMHAYS